MNDAHKEINKLHEQISQLYMVVKQLSEYVGWQDISHLNLSLDSNSMMKLSKSAYSHNMENNLKSKPSMGDSLSLLNQHKDVLVDDETIHSSINENNQHFENISCEEQVHRLTAQLTAAYYRIASLEEQLLSIRHNLEIGENGFYQCQ